MEWMGTGLTVKPSRCQFGRVSGVLCGAESVVVVAPHTTVVLSMPWRRTRKSVICISCVCGLFFPFGTRAFVKKCGFERKFKY